VQYELSVGQERHAVQIREQQSPHGQQSQAGAAQAHLEVELEGTKYDIVVIDAGPPVVLSVDGKIFEVGVDGQDVVVGGVSARLAPRSSAAQGTAAAATSGPRTLNSPMPGRVVRVLCQPGQVIAAGESLLVLEAMKMENELVAPGAGSVTELYVTAGAAIEAGAPLMRLNLT
jgi:biotin carboxyl carrier protein